MAELIIWSAFTFFVGLFLVAIWKLECKHELDYNQKHIVLYGDEFYGDYREQEITYYKCTKCNRWQKV